MWAGLVHTQSVSKYKGWSLPYTQYLELQLGSQYGHRVTEAFVLQLQGHEGFSERSQTKFYDNVD